MRKLVATIAADVAVAGAGAVATQAVGIRDAAAEAGYLLPFIEQDNLYRTQQVTVIL